MRHLRRAYNGSRRSLREFQGGVICVQEASEGLLSQGQTGFQGGLVYLQDPSNSCREASEGSHCFVTYVQESTKEVLYLYAYFIRTSSSFSWVPKHDNNAHMRIFVKEAPVSQRLLKGFRHQKTGPGQDGFRLPWLRTVLRETKTDRKLFQKASESTMSVHYVHTF